MLTIKHRRAALVQAVALALFGAAGGAAAAQSPTTPSTGGSVAGAQTAESPQAAQPEGQNTQSSEAGQQEAATQKGQARGKTTTLGTVTVTANFAHSLDLSTDFKRNATNFVDTVFAEGIGKFPDVNIAESISRLPGVQLSRDNTGQGLNISIRGLGSSFTKVLLDGADVDTAETGLDQQNQNREVDLNIFPSEFFSQLTVNKTPKASMLEGGIAGVVNMQTLRPLDDEPTGAHLTYNLRDFTTDAAKRKSQPNGSLIGSWVNDNHTFGVLLGVGSLRTKQVMKGYESIGWTTPGLTYAQCGLTAPPGTAPNVVAPRQAACNSAGGGNWTIPVTVPATAGAGLTPGETIDNAFLLQNNPGLSTSQISNALIPRLGRPAYISDSQVINSGIFALQYAPNDNVDFYLDMLYAKAKRDTDRTDMDLVGRNGNMIPLNMQVDTNGVVTQGTFTNAQFFLEARPYQNRTQFWSIDPGADVYFGSEQNVKLHVQGFLRRSWMFSDVPSILVNSPFSTIAYANGGGIPTAVPQTSNFSLNDPNLGWTWNRLNIQNSERVTWNRGANADLRFGDDQNNLTVGYNVDVDSRIIEAFDNSVAWQAATCDAAGTTTCNGGPGAVIPTSQLPSFLSPGPGGFIAFNYPKLFDATNYYQLSADAPQSGSVQTGANSGSFKDRDAGYYAEVNTTSEVLSRPMHINVGVRYVTTSQTIAGPVTTGGQTVWQAFGSNYDNFLPSFNLTWNVLSNVMLRMAASRSMTRPDPSAMLPSTSFSDPSAQVASKGNAALQPYKSTNFDIGGEWYTGGAGYIGLDVFTKHILGFTVNGVITEPFNALGIAFISLLPVQQQALNQRGGPDNATVDVQTQVNADGLLKIFGQELDWVQPLDFVTKGLGVTFNYTHVGQTSSGSGVPAVATGVSPHLWNGTVYYERGPGMVRLMYSWQSAQIASGTNQNGITAARLYNDPYHQWDLSAAWTVSPAIQITFDVTNITNQSQRTYFEFSNATYQSYQYGRTFMVGIHGSI